MSVLSPALATSSGAPWAHPLTPLESALTDCCLSYKQNAPVSPLESALTNASHLLESAYFETACFDTLAQTSPASPLESALTKTPGVGGPSLLDALYACAAIEFARPLFSYSYELLSTQPLYFDNQVLAATKEHGTKLSKDCR